MPQLSPDAPFEEVPAGEVVDQPSVLMRGLERLYQAVLSGTAYLPGGGPLVVAGDASAATRDRLAERVVRQHAAMAAGLGFATNVGGLITLPLALPANLVGVTAVQLKMVQEIARIYGHDPRSPGVMAFAFAALLGGKAVELVDRALLPVAGRLATRMVDAIPSAALATINRAVGFQLVTKLGAGGVVNIGRWIPLAGGVLCGTVDGGATYGVGQAAKRLLGKEALLFFKKEALS